MSQTEPPECALELTGIEETEVEGSTHLDLLTSDGVIHCRYHRAQPSPHAVIWVFGAGGGWNGPAGGLYPRLARKLAPQRIASLEVAYRYPARLQPCVFDVLLAMRWLVTQGRTKFVLVGHSFGGAVVLATAVLAPEAHSIAALSSQLAGAREAVGRLSGRRLLFLHGEQDEILPAYCSRQLYALASAPKELITYPNCLHGLDECRDHVDRDLLRWLQSSFD
jgi:pimeloyl-ACP methyl ester carboxylesterase